MNKPLAELQEELETAKKNEKAVAAVLAKTRADDVKPERALTSATEKRAVALVENEKAELRVIAEEGSAGPLRALDAARSSVHGLGLVVADATHRRSTSLAAIVAAETAHADVVARVAEIERQILVHGETIRTKTDAPARRFLAAARELTSSWAEVDAELRAARRAAGSEYQFSVLAPQGFCAWIPLLTALAEEGRVPTSKTAEDELRYAFEACRPGEPGSAPATVRACAIVLLIRGMLDGPPASDAAVAQFKARLEHWGNATTFTEAAEAEQRAAALVDAARNEQGAADAARYRAERQRQIASGTYKPPPRPANYSDAPRRIADQAVAPVHYLEEGSLKPSVPVDTRGLFGAVREVLNHFDPPKLAPVAIDDCPPPGFDVYANPFTPR
jgi:hypothetical protein